MQQPARYVAWTPLLLSGILMLSGCAKNPTGSLFQDGRLFVIVDFDSQFANAWLLTIQAEVEGFDPVLITIFDFDRGSDILNSLPLDVANALNWSEVQGKPIPVLKEVIKGGSEVRITAATFRLDSVTLPPFKLDSNTSVQVFILDPDLPGSKHLQIRRSTIGSAL